MDKDEPVGSILSTVKWLTAVIKALLRTVLTRTIGDVWFSSTDGVMFAADSGTSKTQMVKCQSIVRRRPTSSRQSCRDSSVRDDHRPFLDENGNPVCQNTVEVDLNRCGSPVESDRRLSIDNRLSKADVSILLPTNGSTRATRRAAKREVGHLSTARMHRTVEQASVNMVEPLASGTADSRTSSCADLSSSSQRSGSDVDQILPTTPAVVSAANRTRRKRSNKKRRNCLMMSAVVTSDSPDLDEVGRLTSPHSSGEQSTPDLTIDHNDCRDESQPTESAYISSIEVQTSDKLISSHSINATCAVTHEDRETIVSDVTDGRNDHRPSESSISDQNCLDPTRQLQSDERLFTASGSETRQDLSTTGRSNRPGSKMSFAASPTVLNGRWQSEASADTSNAKPSTMSAKTSKRHVTTLASTNNGSSRNVTASGNERSQRLTFKPRSVYTSASATVECEAQQMYFDVNAARIFLHDAFQDVMKLSSDRNGFQQLVLFYSD